MSAILTPNIQPSFKLKVSDGEGKWAESFSRRNNELPLIFVPVFGEQVIDML
jgi:hypothetical protein